ncbi:hypothetical protein NQ314_016085, partial [Rhamnusium bicolor]
LFTPALALICLSFVENSERALTVTILVLGTDKALWTIVFCTAAGVFMAAGIFYIFAASGEIQLWNHTEQNKEKKSNTGEII